MRTGPALPLDSCTFGPAGTVGALGGAGRFAGTVWTSSVRLSPSHSIGCEPKPDIMALTATAGSLRILPVSVSPIQSSTDRAAILVKREMLAVRTPLRRPRFHVGRSAQLSLSAPSRIRFSVKAEK